MVLKSVAFRRIMVALLLLCSVQKCRIATTQGISKSLLKMQMHGARVVLLEKCFGKVKLLIAGTVDLLRAYKPM